MDRPTETSMRTGGRMVLVVITLVALSACGGSSNDKKYAIGGTVSGLNGTLVLQNNGAESLGITANGAFAFKNKVKSGNAYAVTVATQPAGQTCTVTNGSGTASADVTNVAVTCTANQAYTVGGTVSGLGTGLNVVLRINGGGDLTVNANGPFTFGAPVASGLPYAVTVLTQPTGQSCEVTAGSGTVNGANVTNVAVTCSTYYSIGGTISGLSGTLVMRAFTYGDDYSFTTNGAFTFGELSVNGNAYAVTVVTQPAGQTCAVTNGSGTVNGANVTNVLVACTTNPPPQQTYTIGGSILGLAAGTTVVLQNNGGDNLSRGATGAFTFATRLANGAAYSVTVLTQPAGQTCAVTNGSGNVAGANVTSVSVNCSSNTTDYSIGGTITGLTGAGLKIQDTSASVFTATSGATTFTLPVRRGNNYEYQVGITAQPAGQTCVLLKSHGIVASANVTDVDVRCIANVTDPLVGTYTVPALSASGTSYVYMTLYADGVYIYGSVENNGTNCGTTNGGNGVEYGVYNYNATTHAFTIKSAVVDTNGGCGVWDNGARYAGTLTKAGTGQTTVLTLAVTGGPTFDLVPVASTTGQMIGSWSNAYHNVFFVFLPAGGTSVYSFFAVTQTDSAATSTGQEAGIEYACGSASALTGGTYTPDFNPATCQAPAPDVNGPVDTNGTGGLSSSQGPLPFTISVDTLSAGEDWTRVKPN